jgi:predicted RNA-binding Zn ribbon-like protein
MSNPAPGALEKVRAFVNTLDVEHATDELSAPAGLARWLAGEELLGGASRTARATAADLCRAIALRDALRAHLRAHHGDPLDLAPAAQVLDATARRARLTLRFSAPEQTTLVPEAAGVAGALGRLLAIVKHAIDDGTWSRLKVCPADDCQWAFYDTSRNRSAVWCDMRVCGNRAKVREFRERTRSGSDAAGAPARRFG